MKKIMYFLVLSFVFGCNKKNDVNSCMAEMRIFFGNDLGCIQMGGMEVHLNRAEFKGQSIYFPEIMCTYCQVAPPTTGYNCQFEPVKFGDYQLLKNVRRVYDSCMDRFLE